MAVSRILSTKDGFMPPPGFGHEPPTYSPFSLKEFNS